MIVEKNSSKRILFGQKTKQRWFYLDGRTLKNLHFSDHTSEGSLEVATFLRVKSKTSAAAVANESKYQFELETVDGHVHAFGNCKFFDWCFSVVYFFCFVKYYFCPCCLF